MFKKFFNVNFIMRACFIFLCACICVDTAATIAGISLPFLAWLPEPGTGSMMLIGIGATTVAGFPVDPENTAISLAYKNPRFVADSVFPRRPVGKQNFKIKSFPKGTYLTVPQTVTSRKGFPNEIEIGYTESDSSTIDHVLDNPVPNDDIENAPQGYDPLGAATEQTTQLILLDREIRAATVAFDTTNYSASNQSTLSGTTQFSHASSTPISTIEGAIEACFFRPNKAVMGRAVWTKLCQHADIVAACNRNSGTKGKATLRDVADLFELDEILVGEGWYNSAKPGQNVVTARVWGKSMLLFFDDPTATPDGGVTFGMTAQWGSRIVNRIDEPKRGARGCQTMRVGESVKEYICANDLGYLLDAAVA